MLRKNGLKGVFINGSSGEGYMLTDDERKQLTEAWIAAAPKDFKVIVHVGACCVKSAKELARHAAEHGAWGIGSHGSAISQNRTRGGTRQIHRRDSVGSPGLPFYFYHIPAFNGAFLPMVKLLEAVDGRVPNFAGIKYTFESMYEYNQCRLYGNGKFDMLHGQDENHTAVSGHGRRTRRNRRHHQLQRP